MSDPKRANLITVNATKSGKNNVKKTVRLTINLDESNENNYPKLNYKELVTSELRKKVVVENGKSAGLNPYSDNDEDVERVARKFEQKYGGNSTYGKKGTSKHDDFADIGAGYDENDSFIDNTDGYDEMIPPECETLCGGFYINSGLLEFKNAENQPIISDGELAPGRRNKRRISSSSSGDCSDSSSDRSRGGRPAAPGAMHNGARDARDTEHRKKKNMKIDQKKAKKIRRTDSSAATSGKQTSDDHGDAESADSRTSQSDSLTSKPAPSSENAITSDSSRDMEAKVDVKLPPAVTVALEQLEAAVSRQLMADPGAGDRDLLRGAEHYVGRLERSLCACNAESRARRVAWGRAARALGASRARLLQRARAITGQTSDGHAPADTPSAPTPVVSQSPPVNTAGVPITATHSNKRKAEDEFTDDISHLTEQEREEKIVEALHRLKSLIDEKKPGMMANYNAECERVQEERKKIQIASAEGAPVVEKRLPKRRFPWCPRSRVLLARLSALAGGQQAAGILLVKRALPLFPSGFVRVPTLLRQADLSKEIKASDLKRQRLGSSSMPSHPMQPMQYDQLLFPEQIQFPSTLTVTTTSMKTEKNDVAIGTNDNKPQYKTPHSVFGSILNAFSLSKDLVVETPEDKRKDSVIVEKANEDLYVPPNNIGSITITAVPTQPKAENKNNKEGHKESLIRVKSPAALNEMVQKKEKEKALDNIHRRDKDKHKKSDRDKHSNDRHSSSERHRSSEKHHSSERHHSNDRHSNSDKHQSDRQTVKDKKLDTPLHIDTTQSKPRTPTPSPKSKIEEITRRQIETMRVAENNIPRPALIPVHHSPTFAKPDKRPPEIKKKKDLVIVSDLDPLSDGQAEPVAVDDSSSDVEVIEDSKSDKTSVKSESVPSKDTSVRDIRKVDIARHSKDVNERSEKSEKLDEAMKEDFNSLMKNLKDLENSQEPKITSNSFGGVITSAQDELL